jgi:outer membrane protein insertion porin family
VPDIDAATRCFGDPPGTLFAPQLPALRVETPVEGVVSDVQVRLAGQLDLSIVRGLLSVRAGDPVDPERVRADVRRLFALGNFEDVSVQATPSPGGWTLTYVLQERPVVREARVRGAPPPLQSDLEAAAGQHAGDLFVPASLHRGVDAMRRRLVELGYAHAKVDPFIRRRDARTADVCLWVEAGPAVRVQSVVFEGRSKLEEDQLEKALRNAGSESNLPGGMLDPSVLEVQLLHVTAAYYDAGMVNVRLGEPELRYSEDRTRVAIHVSVQEGDVFRVGAVAFAAPMNANATRYGAVLGFGQGDVFSRTKVMAAIERLQSLRLAEGGAGSIEPVTVIDAEKRTIDLTFQLSASSSP